MGAVSAKIARLTEERDQLRKAAKVIGGELSLMTSEVVELRTRVKELEGENLDLRHTIETPHKLVDARKYNDKLEARVKELEEALRELDAMTVQDYSDGGHGEIISKALQKDLANHLEPLDETKGP